MSIYQAPEVDQLRSGRESIRDDRPAWSGLRRTPDSMFRSGNSSGSRRKSSIPQNTRPSSGARARPEILSPFLFGKPVAGFPESIFIVSAKATNLRRKSAFIFEHRRSTLHQAKASLHTLRAQS